MKKQLKKMVGKKTARRMTQAMPYVAGALAVFVGNAIRERGVRSTFRDLRDAAGRDKDEQ